MKPKLPTKQDVKRIDWDTVIFALIVAVCVILTLVAIGIQFYTWKVG